ncbi:sugar transferase [Longimonas halophila]|uniref:Sugar transferase n=1 Tax=Longimonas halophila TaxID=1469170 RepID=A0A2H3NN25_9BACT|nr:sugar transferase [Longimonas halophila]PEN06250.1 sugar transferase [Longimonas halophila]
MSYATCKSIAERLLAAGALVVLSPLLALIAGAIALIDGRPVVFTQQRAGKNGQPFRIYKFRTLCLGPKDPERPGAHCTRTGGFLRRWALDELPQLWNIVRGDMGVIGPRPTLLNQVRRYGAFERTRLQVKPGLTGWAQIHGRNALSWPERIRLDVWYVKHQSPWVDAKILLHTPRVLWRGTGVYGPTGANDAFAQSPTSSS